jgi:hypothetical protein
VNSEAANVNAFWGLLCSAARTAFAVFVHVQVRRFAVHVHVGGGA